MERAGASQPPRSSLQAPVAHAEAPLSVHGCRNWCAGLLCGQKPAEALERPGTGIRASEPSVRRFIARDLTHSWLTRRHGHTRVAEVSRDCRAGANPPSSNLPQSCAATTFATLTTSVRMRWAYWVPAPKAKVAWTVTTEWPFKNSTVPVLLA